MSWKRRCSLSLLFMGLLVLISGQAVLAVGTFGGTDLINIPSSTALPHGEYCLGAHLRENDYTKLQFDMGLTPNFEIGGVLNFQPKDENFSLRAKLRLVPETKDSYGLALGLQDLGNERFTSYLVASHSFPALDLRWHLGFGTGGLDGFFAGLTKVYNSITISEGKRHSTLPRVILSGEYDGSGLNLGARIDIGMGIFLDLAVMRMEDFLIGVAYNSYL